MAAALVLLAVCVSVSVTAYEDVFTYVKPDFFRRAGEDDCQICYGDNDCLTMNEARCEFYTATSEVLFDDEGPSDSTNLELRAEVDSLMMDLAEESSQTLAFQECVPFVSEYTDCTKENICSGCRSCSCNEYSRWNCSLVQRCRPEDPLEVDHRALVITVENLRGGGIKANPFRMRRSISNTSSPEHHNLTFEEIAQWMYDAAPFNGDDVLNATDAPESSGVYTITTEGTDENRTTRRDEVNVLTTVGDTATTAKSDTDSEYTNIAFDDVLNDIFIQNTNYTRKKTLNMTHVDNLEHDHMKLDDVNVTMDGMSMADQFVNILHAIEGDVAQQAVTTTEGVTKVVIDLLELAKNKMELSGNDLNSTDTEVTLQNDTVFADSDNIEFNSINIMKRDVSKVTEDKLNDTFTEKNSNTNGSNDLKSSIYLPLNTMIQDKQKELDDLLHVKDKLIKLLNLDQESNATLVKIENPENRTNSYINFYNVQILPQTEYSYKRSGYELLDKYMMKLRQDVYVVVKDIIRIQALTGHKDFPERLKVLTRAIKHFMRNHTKSHKNNALRTYDLRRHKMYSHMTKDFVKDTLIHILLSIDRYIPESDLLGPLSVKTKRIIKRVIKTNKPNEYSVMGLRVNDPHYNLTNDLKSIGLYWQDMSVKISKSSPWDRLHHMKMLQLVLESDIDKMKDALALIDFAHSRRMVAMQDDENKDELSRINSNLRSIHDQISELKKLPFMNASGKRVVKLLTVTKQNKKESLLKHIKNLLKSSKRDIVSLLRKRMPKADIVKTLAKKKMSELTKNKLMEYQHIMQKWQNQLDITRKKRSLGYDKFNMRTLNILPKYLRGKVSSGMNSTKHKNKPRHSERRMSKKNKPKFSTTSKPATSSKSTYRPKPKSTTKALPTSKSRLTSTSTVKISVTKSENS